MSFNFKNKKVLIVSPNSWGKMHVSKHHYAIEVARRGADVYFLNPLVSKGPNLSIETITYPDFNIKVITAKPWFSLDLRFHFPNMFNLLLGLFYRKFQKDLKVQFDVVWSFNPYHLVSFSPFKNAVKIFHPVDQLLQISDFSSAKTADIVLTVSDHIFQSLKPYNQNVSKINHGVADMFFTDENDSAPINNSSLKVGYVGNLLMPFIDWESLKKVVSSHPQIFFYFWGAYSKIDCNVGGTSDPAVSQCINWLASQQNVVLKGPVSPSDLALQIKEMDMFLICYRTSEMSNVISNSHKVLEYLSTGKTIVSNLIKEYEGSDLMVFPFPEETYPDAFSRAVSGISGLNSAELTKKRKAFSKGNSYRNHCMAIEKLILEHISGEGK